MRNKAVLFTPNQVRQALEDLGNPGNLTEGLVFTAIESYLHLMDGGSVDGFVLVDEDYLADLKTKAFGR